MHQVRFLLILIKLIDFTVLYHYLLMPCLALKTLNRLALFVALIHLIHEYDYNSDESHIRSYVIFIQYFLCIVSLFIFLFL